MAGGDADGWPDHLIRCRNPASLLQEQLSVMIRRQVIAAELSLPAHLLGRRPLQEQRAARRAKALQLYRPHLRAAATSVAVGASTALPLPTSQVARSNSTAAATGATHSGSSNHAAGDSTATARIGVTKQRDDDHLKREFDWAALVSTTLPRFYRSLTAPPKHVAADGGRIGKAPGCRSTHVAADDEGPEDVMISIQQHLMHHPPSELARLLLPTCTSAPAESTTDQPVNISTIYTGVADLEGSGYDTLPGRAAVSIGLLGALAFDQLVCDPQTVRSESWHGGDRAGPGQREIRAEHMRSAVVLADALLQRRGAGTLTYLELQCLVMVIACLQVKVVLSLSGAATAASSPMSSLALLVAIARGIARHTRDMDLDDEARARAISEYMAVHETAAKAAAQDDRHIHTPRWFLDMYMCHATKLMMPPKDEARHARTRMGAGAAPRSGLVCKGEGRQAVEEETRQAWDCGVCVLHAVTEVLPGRHPGGVTGRAGPGRLDWSVLQNEQQRKNLLKQLLAVGLDGCCRSVIAVGCYAIKTSLMLTGLMGRLRQESSQLARPLLVTSSSDTAAAVREDATGSSQGAVPLAAPHSITTCLEGPRSQSDAPLNGGCDDVKEGTGAAVSSDALLDLGGADEGVLAVRLMTSAQLVTQHGTETSRSGVRDAEDGLAGPCSSSSSKQQPLDPYCLPDGMSPVVAVTMLPLPGALSDHVSLACKRAETVFIYQSSEEFATTVERLLSILRQSHAVSVCGVLADAAKKMVLCGARVREELLKEGVDVLVVPDVEVCHKEELQVVLDLVRSSMLDSQPCGQQAGDDREGDGEGGAACSGGRSGRDGRLNESAQQAQSSSLEGVQMERRPRLRPDWRGRRRCTLNGIVSGVLQLHRAPEPPREERLERCAEGGTSGGQATCGSSDKSSTVAASPTLLRQRRAHKPWGVRDMMTSWWLKLTFLAFEMKPGGGLGEPLPLPEGWGRSVLSTSRR